MSEYVVVDRLDTVIKTINNLNTSLDALNASLEYISGQLKTVTANQTSAMNKTYNVKVME